MIAYIDSGDRGGTAVKVVGSIVAGIIGIFH